MNSKALLTRKEIIISNGGGAIPHSDLERKIELEMEKQAEKVIYLQADAEVPTGQTVEIIGLTHRKPVEGYA